MAPPVETMLQATLAYCYTRSSGRPLPDNLIQEPRHSSTSSSSSSTSVLEACTEGQPIDVLRRLIWDNCNLNLVHDSLGVAPIHVAILCQNIPVVRMLLEQESLDVNVRDKHGDTPLHYVVRFIHDQHQAELFVRQMLDKGAAVDVENREGNTAIMEAAALNKKELVKAMLPEADLDEEMTGGETLRFVIQTHIPDFDFGAAHTDPRSKYKRCLFLTLYVSDFENFLRYVREPPLLNDAQLKTLLDENDGQNTFLQKACSLPDADDVVGVLLRKGVDPNLTTSRGNESPPLVIAAEQRNYDVMDKLLDVAAANINVNLKNGDGDSALHVVAKSDNLRMMVKLLNKGARLDVKNKLQQIPFKTEVIKSVMDMCVDAETCNENGYRYKLSYGTFIQQQPAAAPGATESRTELNVDQDSRNARDVWRNLTPVHSESAILCYIIQTYRDVMILKHPLVTTFIYLKWERVLLFYWLNLAWVFLFTIILNIFVTTDCHKSGQCTDGVFTSLVVLTLIFWLGIVMREALQLLPNIRKYMGNRENILDVAVIFSSAWSVYYMIVDWPNEDHRLISSVLTVLLSSLELFVVSGKFHIFAQYMELLKTATKNSLIFLLWHSTLLVGFSQCFYLVLKSTDQSFSTVWLSMFKVYTMMIGNVDTDSISSSSMPGVTIVLFVVFVFLICIVVFTGIGGALSGVEDVRQTAALLSVQSQMRLIKNIEHTLIRVYELRLLLVSRFLRREHFMIFPEGDGHDVYIHPNSNSYLLDGGHRVKGEIEPNVFLQAKNILQARAANSATQLWL